MSVDYWFDKAKGKEKEAWILVSGVLAA